MPAVVTGRKFYVLNGECEATFEEPTNTNEYAEWTEWRDGSDYWYVSDHEDYTLTAEEFGPLPGDIEADPCLKGTPGCWKKIFAHDDCEGY